MDPEKQQEEDEEEEQFFHQYYMNQYLMMTTRDNTNHNNSLTTVPGTSNVGEAPTNPRIDSLSNPLDCMDSFTSFKPPHSSFSQLSGNSIPSTAALRSVVSVPRSPSPPSVDGAGKSSLLSLLQSETVEETVHSSASVQQHAGDNGPLFLTLDYNDEELVYYPYQSNNNTTLNCASNSDTQLYQCQLPIHPKNIQQLDLEKGEEEGNLIHHHLHHYQQRALPSPSTSTYASAGQLFQLNTPSVMNPSSNLPTTDCYDNSPCYLETPHPRHLIINHPIVYESYPLVQMNLPTPEGVEGRLRGPSSEDELLNPSPLPTTSPPLSEPKNKELSSHTRHKRDDVTDQRNISFNSNSGSQQTKPKGIKKDCFFRRSRMSPVQKKHKKFWKHNTSSSSSNDSCRSGGSEVRFVPSEFQPKSSSPLQMEAKQHPPTQTPQQQQQQSCSSYDSSLIWHNQTGHEVRKRSLLRARLFQHESQSNITTQAHHSIESSSTSSSNNVSNTSSRSQKEIDQLIEVNNFHKKKNKPYDSMMSILAPIKKPVP